MIEQVFTFKRTAALCLMGAFCSLNAQAQKITVKGSVVDGTGPHSYHGAQPQDDDQRCLQSAMGEQGKQG